MKCHNTRTFIELCFSKGHKEKLRNNCNMHSSQKIRSLAVIVCFVCIAVTAATEKGSVCCKEVSAKKITVPITGFRVQLARPPCVKAVIFFTSKDAVCSHWKETWVKEKVYELRRLQAKEKSLKMNTTTTAPHTADSTNSYNTTSRIYTILA